MEDNILDRTLYKQIKNMKREEMEAFLKRIFENGYKKAVNEQGAASSSADFEKLRVKSLAETLVDSKIWYFWWD